MEQNNLAALYAIMSGFGGISLIIWVSVQAKIAHMKAQAKLRQQWIAPPGESSTSRNMPTSRNASTSRNVPPSQDGAVLAELRDLKLQVAQLQSTSHEFDLSFDEALNRLEARVGRLETKSVASTAAPAPAEAMLRNGTSTAP